LERGGTRPDPSFQAFNWTYYDNFKHPATSKHQTFPHHPESWLKHDVLAGVSFTVNVFYLVMSSGDTRHCYVFPSCFLYSRVFSAWWRYGWIYSTIYHDSPTLLPQSRMSSKLTSPAFVSHRKNKMRLPHTPDASDPQSPPFSCEATNPQTKTMPQSERRHTGNVECPNTEDYAPTFRFYEDDCRRQWNISRPSMPSRSYSNETSYLRRHQGPRMV